MSDPALNQPAPWIERLALGVALVLPSLVTLVYFVWLADRPSGWQQFAYGLGKLAQFSLPVLFVCVIQRRSLAIGRCALSGLVEGALMGTGILAAMALFYFGWFRTGGIPPAALQALRDKMSGLGVASPARFLALGVFYALGHSLLEEYYWRWFVYRQWRAQFSRPIAVALSAAGFTAHHVLVLGEYFGWRSAQSLFLVMFFSLAVGIGGVLWAWLYERQGSIYGVWISHLLVDAGIFAVGYDLVLR